MEEVKEPVVEVENAAEDADGQEGDDEDMPNWQRVRNEFARLPGQRQLQARLERASERLQVHLERTVHWSAPGKDASGKDVDVALEMRRQMVVARDALNAAAAWNRQIRDDWRPAATPGTRTAAPAKEIVPGGSVRLKGSAAKAEPEYAKGTVVFVEKYGDEKHPRARCVAPDGTKFACAYRDLSAA